MTIQKSGLRTRASQPWIAIVAMALFATVAHAEPIAAGSAQRSVTVGGEVIELYTYKPPQYSGGPILMVLHGLGTNARGYRDYAIPLADAGGYLVIAPLLDRKRFPTWRYQTGGIVRDRRAAGEFQIEPETGWTGKVFLRIIDAVRDAEGRPGLGYALIGHSAGGQNLSRFAAFEAHQARRIIIANPSTYLWPSREERFPYGFGGLPAPLSDDAALQRYLAQPITVLLGTADTQRGKDLNVTAGAESQGANRLERGHNAFNAARQLAREKGWPFGWRLIEIPEVGHSARLMLGNAQALEALSGD